MLNIIDRDVTNKPRQRLWSQESLLAGTTKKKKREKKFREKNEKEKEEKETKVEKYKNRKVDRKIDGTQRNKDERISNLSLVCSICYINYNFTFLHAPSLDARTCTHDY